jgi:hypothetical protein
LHEYFEHIDRIQVELLLPFYDKRVLAAVLRIPPPLDGLIQHRLYGKIVSLFPDLFHAAPWQTYDDHEECPISEPHPPRRQWEPNDVGERVSDLWMRRAATLACNMEFPSDILRRSTVLTAASLHALGHKGHDHVFKRAINLTALRRISEAFTLDAHAQHAVD